MVTQQTTAITPQDLQSFLDDHGDFAFEMRIRSIFTAKKLRTDHNGSYTDPHKGVPREFDIQVDFPRRDIERKSRVLLAVESKNLGEESPVLVSRTKRRPAEAGHNVIASINSKVSTQVSELFPRERSGETLRLWAPAITLPLGHASSPYRSGEMVGKSIDQVYRKGNNVLAGGDSELHGRWSQALHSAASMIPKAAATANDFQTPLAYVALLPILVVPNDRLFVADFSEQGLQLGAIQSVDAVEYYVDYNPGQLIKRTPFGSGGPDFRFTHIDIMTESGLSRFVRDLLGETMIADRDWLTPHKRCDLEFSAFITSDLRSR